MSSSQVGLRFLEAIYHENKDLPHLTLEGRSPVVQEIAKAFEANLSRSLQSCGVVVNASVLATRAYDCLSRAAAQLGLDLSAPISEEQHGQLNALGGHLFHVERLRLIGDREGEQASSWEIAEWCFGFFDQAPTMRGGMSVALASGLIHGWTAFETASSDLWEDALNAHPDPWAIAAIGVRDGDNDEGVPKTISEFIAKLIADGETDKAGTLIKRTGRFNFQKYAGIQGAYERVFGGDAKNLFVSAPFLDLHVLSASRNVLVHRAGKIDRKFQLDEQAHPAEFLACGFGGLPLGSELPVAGPVVRRLLRSASAATALLLSFVDDRIAKPKRPTSQSRSRRAES